MEESQNDIDNSYNFNLLNDIKDSDYKIIKSYQINIMDKSYLFELCKSNDNKNIIFICKRNKNDKNNNINNIDNEENDKIYYEGKYNLDQLILNNKFFNIFDSIDEVIKEIKYLFDDNQKDNIEINFENDSFNKLLLKLKFPILRNKNKEVILELLCKGINDKNINLYFYKEIQLLQQSDNLMEKEIEELKKQNELINNRLSKLEDIIKKENNKYNNKIENFFNEMENQGINKDIIDSYLIYKKEDLDFLNNRLLQDKYVPKGKTVKYKLLYRTSKNGENSKIFHELCDNYAQTLTVIKSVKGRVFGGYTEQTWKNTDIKKMGVLKKDNKAFLFSLNNKKIYNIYYDQPAIWCHESNGPCFYGKGNFTIYSKEKLINGIMKTNKVKESTFIGMEKDYELTDGEESFNALEIEVFQVLFN